VIVASPPTQGQEARATRAEVEAALDRIGWVWRPGLSRWLDVLIILEETPSS
jgi:hypothetical protein